MSENTNNVMPYKYKFRGVAVQRVSVPEDMFLLTPTLYYYDI